MTEDEVQAWRRTRLEALANKLGGKAALGRKLGYADGAFVGQMISGLRPVTEKTVRAAEAIRGCRNWFSFLPPEEMPPPAVKYADVLTDLETIPPGLRHRFIDQIQEAAELARETLAYHANREPAMEKPLTAEEEKEAKGLEIDPGNGGSGRPVSRVLKSGPQRSK